MKLTFAVLLAVSCCFIAGCTLFRDTPRSRLGALPFPGVYTLYTAADPNHLGRHRYGRLPRLFRQDESQRGILYTTRAGFLDLAHLRMTVDWTRYYVAGVRRAIDAGADRLTLDGLNHSRLHVRLHYPQWWQELDDAERGKLSGELALRVGQRLAHSMFCWHEIVTWFGARTLPLVDESPSAFTYDDTMSHVIGVRVAERALRDGTRRYDDAVTAALRAELKEQGAAKPAQTDEAVRAVEGLWWADGKPLKRQIDIKPDESCIYPWLARRMSFCPDLEPQPFELPRLDDVLGREASGFYSAEIDPRVRHNRRLLKLLPGNRKRVSREDDLAILLDVIRGQMQEKFGPEVSQPWLDHAPAAP